MKKIIRYYVESEHHTLVCGPFSKKEIASEWAKNYTNTKHFFGKCHVVSKIIDVEGSKER